MKIADFYKSILTVGSMVADDNGLISARVDTASVPILVGGKRLVLPTKEHISNPDKSEIVLFHPLSENILRGESDVMAKFRNTTNIRLNYVLGVLLTEIITLSTSPKMMVGLDPDRLELLTIFKDADEKTLPMFHNLLKAMGQGNIEKCFVHFFIKKGATIHGKSHRRGAIATFPLYEELSKNESGAYGVKIRKKDHASLIAALEYILPNIGTKDAYSRGSLSDYAPTLDALLLGVLGIASHLNSIIEKYNDVLENIRSLSYADDWVPMLDNMNLFVNELRLLPMQSGNEGTTERQMAAEQAIRNVTPAPVVQQIPYTQPGVNYPYQQPPAPPPVTVTASGKLDFNSIIRANPHMQQSMQPQYAPRPMAPNGRSSDPTWATNSNTYGNNGYAFPQPGYRI